MQLKTEEIENHEFSCFHSLSDLPETSRTKHPNNTVDRSFILFSSLLFSRLLLFTFLRKKALEATTTKSKFVIDNKCDYCGHIHIFRRQFDFTVAQESLN